MASTNSGTAGRPVAFATDDLLDAARHTFVREGYAAAQMTSVAALARVTKQTLYARLGTKEQLLLKLVGRDATRLGDHLLQRYSEAEGLSGGQKVSVAVDALFDFCEAEPESFVLLFSARVGGPAFDRDELVLARVRAGVARLVREGADPQDPPSHSQIEVLAALAVEMALECARSALERQEIGVTEARQLATATITAMLRVELPAV